jgi:lysophospholipase L1-like esterase
MFGILAGTTLTELVLRMFWPTSDRYSIWLPNFTETFTPAPGVMPGVGPMGRIQINSQGVRGPEWSSNRATEYRILTVGGSTTECLYLDQNKTWTALLHVSLNKTADGRRVWAGSVGKAGFNTRDHLGLMRFAIDQYDVDLIVILIGGNDMVHRFLQGDKYEPRFVEDESRYREWLRNRFASVPDVFSKEEWFFKRAALWDIAQQMKHKFRNKIVQDNAGSWLVKLRNQRQQASLVNDLPLLDDGLAEYERNIMAIAQEARGRSLRVVFLTQPTMWRESMTNEETKFLWMGWRPGAEFYTTDALARAMQSYNQRLLATCDRTQLECIDMASRIPRTLEFFYDDMHFTELGARHVAAELSAYLSSHPPFAEFSH